MGAAGSDDALETANIALMGDKLSLLPFAIGLNRQSKRIIKQNLVISLGVVAVMAHKGSTLVVVFNALRLLAYKQQIPVYVKINFNLCCFIFWISCEKLLDLC